MEESSCGSYRLSLICAPKLHSVPSPRIMTLASSVSDHPRRRASCGRLIEGGLAQRCVGFLPGATASFVLPDAHGLFPKKELRGIMRG